MITAGVPVGKVGSTNMIKVQVVAGALVIQEAGLTSHAAIAALEYGIPAIIGLPEAMATISEGQRITVDALAGVIYEGTVSIL